MKFLISPKFAQIGPKRAQVSGLSLYQFFEGGGQIGRNCQNLHENERITKKRRKLHENERILRILRLGDFDYRGGWIFDFWPLRGGSPLSPPQKKTLGMPQNGPF